MRKSTKLHNEKKTTKPCLPVFRLPVAVLPPDGGGEPLRGAVHVGGVDGRLGVAAALPRNRGEVEEELRGHVGGGAGGLDGGAADDEEPPVEPDPDQVLGIPLYRPADFLNDGMNAEREGT